MSRGDQELEDAQAALTALDEEATQLKRERDQLTAVVDESEANLATARAQLAPELLIAEAQVTLLLLDPGDLAPWSVAVEQVQALRELYLDDRADRQELSLAVARLAANLS